MRNFIAICVAGPAALCLLVAGCGGSGDEGQIDKATFVERANEICEGASGRLAAEVASISKRESSKPNYDFAKSQIVLVKDALIPRLEEELQAIRALGLPAEGKQEAEALLVLYRKVIARTKARARAVALNERATPYEAIALAATRFGISECPISPVNAPAPES